MDANEVMMKVVPGEVALQGQSFYYGIWHTLCCMI